MEAGCSASPALILLVRLFTVRSSVGGVATRSALRFRDGSCWRRVSDCVVVDGDSSGVESSLGLGGREALSEAANLAAERVILRDMVSGICQSHQ